MHDDLWAEEIWKRLPIESLCRFRCVCKRWNSLISSPSFINLHYTFALSTTPCSLKPYLHVFCRDQAFYRRFEVEIPSHERYALCYPLDDEDDQQQQLYFPFRAEEGARNPKLFCHPLDDEDDQQQSYFPFRVEEDARNPKLFDEFSDEEDVEFWAQDDVGNPKGCSFVDVIHGIVCISYSACSTFLWNPSIHKYVALPRLSLTRGGAIGFGYDTSKNDFKVVVIEFTSIGHKSLKVYSAQQDFWRQPMAPMAPDIEHLHIYWSFQDKFASCFVNGTIHWLVWRWKSLEEGLEYSVLMFDCESEEVRIMNIPIEIYCSIYEFVLFEYDGMLAALVKTMSSSMNLWVMEEHGVSTSWKKIESASYGPKKERELSASILCDRVYNKSMFLMDHPKACSYSN